MAKLSERFRGWNVFRDNQDPERYRRSIWEASSSNRLDRTRRRHGNERSIVTAIYNRIAVDGASIDLRHVRLDENERFIAYIDSTLDDCLHVSANIDQTGRAMVQDAIMTLLDEGLIAVVPVWTSVDPWHTDGYDIYALRVGKIVEWFPSSVRVELYNDLTGRIEQIIFNKSDCAIIENPFYAIMNERNSMLQRLIRKLNLLDVVDEQSTSSKLDLIVQLPYSVKNPVRKAEAEERRKDIEVQLSGSKYGIAYIDATERVTQLNRSLENNLLATIDYLAKMVYGQLGMTDEILNGSADEDTMLNYYNRMIEPLLAVICEEFSRKFLSKNARTRREEIRYFRDPFKLASTTKIAELADKMTRNEILSSNEMRGIIGYKPVDDPRADELRNKNLNQSADAEAGNIEPVTTRAQVEG